MLDSFWSQQSLGKGKKRNNVIAAASWPPDTHYSNETSLLSYTHVRICLLRHVFFFSHTNNQNKQQRPSSSKELYTITCICTNNTTTVSYLNFLVFFVCMSRLLSFKDRIASKLILFLCCATELKRKNGGKNKGGRRKHTKLLSSTKSTQYGIR